MEGGQQQWERLLSCWVQAWYSAMVFGVCRAGVSGCVRLVVVLQSCERERWDSPAHVKKSGVDVHPILCCMKLVLLRMSSALRKVFSLSSSFNPNELLCKLEM